MAFVENLAAFFSPSDFGDAATFTPSGGSPKTVNGIFDDASESSLDIEGQAPNFTCAAADVAGVRHDDALTVRSVAYKIVGIKPDGQGVVRLRLQLQ